MHLFITYLVFDVLIQRLQLFGGPICILVGQLKVKFIGQIIPSCAADVIVGLRMALFLVKERVVLDQEFDENTTLLQTEVAGSTTRCHHGFGSVNKRKENVLLEF